jgi:uncharacterized protein with HEPN domain
LVASARRGTRPGDNIEAVRHLPDELLESAPDIPWKQIRGIGNILRHEYHKASEVIVWAVVADHLPRLRVAVERMIALVRTAPDRQA